MFAKLNIKGITQTVKNNTQTAVTNYIKKKTSGGCKTCGGNNSR